MEKNGLVFNIMRYSTQDGPGLRTTVFLKGCPLRCDWCHNPESQSFDAELVFKKERCIGCGTCVDVCPENALSFGNETGPIVSDNCTLCGVCAEECPAEAWELIGERMTVSEVMREIEKDLVFYEESGGGATFSGGEPLAQFEFLEELLSACRAAGINTALDTSGAVRWELLDRIRPLVDIFLYDIKVMDENNHKRFTGFSNREILNNLRRLSLAGSKIIIRIPIIPGITDQNSEQERLCEFVASLPNVWYIDLLKYHETGLKKYSLLGKRYRMAGAVTPGADEINELAEKIRKSGVVVKIGGSL